MNLPSKSRLRAVLSWIRFETAALAGIVGFLGLSCYIATQGGIAAIVDRLELVFGRAGLASWYGEEYRGHLMANGQPFDPALFTCATHEYPMGAVLLVRFHDREVRVTVTDRGPARNRLVDLSRAAFAALAPLRDGILPVTIFVLPKP